MTILRFVLAAAVAAYAGWLAWPVLAPFLEGADPQAAAMRAGAEAALGGGVMSVGLWIAAAALYLFAALLLGAGNPKAALAYFLGFAADAVLRLALAGGGSVPADVAARTAEAVPLDAGIDPSWLVLGALLFVGLLVHVAAQRRRRVRVPGQLAA